MLPRERHGGYNTKLTSVSLSTMNNTHKACSGVLVASHPSELDWPVVQFTTDKTIIPERFPGNVATRAKVPACISSGGKRGQYLSARMAHIDYKERQ